jgi:hypothetical protein
VSVVAYVRNWLLENLVALLGCDGVEVVSVSGTKIFAEGLAGGPS